ncbi:MAG: DUF6580 family putative transport protein [Bacteroidota bacterium]
MTRAMYIVAMILAAALSRLLPHPANVTPVTALALFGAVYLDRRSAFLVPLAAMFLSDLVLGFHSDMFWVYGSFVAIVGIGFWLKHHRSVPAMVVASLTGSIVFYLLTNFGMWMVPSSLYQHTMAGLIECYVAGIPFFRNTLLGDLAYVGVLFGLFALLERLVPSLQPDSVTDR